MTYNMLESETADSNAIAAITAEDMQQVLTFQLQEKTFGVDILPVKEIIEYSKIITIPMAPIFVRGVINLRGSVVPVIDLSKRFGWSESPVTKRTCIVIIEMTYEQEKQVFGIVIDSISEVLELPATDIEPAPRFGTNIRTDFIAGMGKVNDEIIVLLNANKVLSVDELSLLNQMADSPVRDTS